METRWAPVSEQPSSRSLLSVQITSVILCVQAYSAYAVLLGNSTPFERLKRISNPRTTVRPCATARVEKFSYLHPCWSGVVFLKRHLQKREQSQGRPRGDPLAALGQSDYSLTLGPEGPKGLEAHIPKAKDRYGGASWPQGKAGHHGVQMDSGPLFQLVIGFLGEQYPHLVLILVSTFQSFGDF